MKIIALLVIKETAWQRYTQDKLDAHVAELLAHNDPAVAKMKPTHDAHVATVNETKEALDSLGIEFCTVPNPYGAFSCDNANLVITIGGDGTLLSASRHVKDLPILGINSAPGSSVGFFSGTRSGSVAATLRAYADGTLKGTRLSRMEVTRNTIPLSKRVLNDALYCHPCPAATSRYLLELHGILEEQTSSGLWIGPAAGSTAAQHSAGGNILPLQSRAMQLVVREPYTPHGKVLRLRRELIEPGEVATVRSKVSEGKLFLDGPHQQFDLELGDVLEFKESDEPLFVLGLDEEQRRTWQ